MPPYECLLNLYPRVSLRRREWPKEAKERYHTFMHVNANYLFYWTHFVQYYAIYEIYMKLILLLLVGIWNLNDLRIKRRNKSLSLRRSLKIVRKMQMKKRKKLRLRAETIDTLLTTSILCVFWWMVCDAYFLSINKFFISYFIWILNV